MPGLRPIVILAVAALALAVPDSGRAAVSYLLVQGDFDSGTAGLESSRWQVNDPGGKLLTGQDLLNAVFGTPQLVSGTHYKTSPTTWIADGSIWEVNYTLSADYGFFVDSFKRNGTTLTSNFGTGQAWNYYNAGGTYVDAYIPPDYNGPFTGPYANGTWTAAYTGTGTRSLADTDGNASADPAFDAWVFGNDGYVALPQVTISGFAPTAGSFAGATLNAVSTSSVPEPSRLLLLLAGSAATLLRRRRATPTRR